MEMNAVLLSINEYNNIIKNYYEFENRNGQLINDIEELADKYDILADFAIEKCIIMYYIGKYTLEEVTNVTSPTFAMDIDNFKKLTKLGISEQRITWNIRRVKKHYDEAHKEDKE